MSNDFLPGSEKELIAWASQFVTLATANITETQLTCAQIAALSAKIQDAQTALDDAAAKRNAAEAATLVKNDKLNALKTNARELNRILQGNHSVTAQTKAKLGLKVRPAKRRLVSSPVTPILQVIGTSDNRNFLSWDAAGNHANSLYELQASYGEDEPFFTVTALTGTRYTHQGVNPGQEMLYRVRAKYRTMYSDYSSTAVVSPQALPERKLPTVNILELKKAA